jgi:uncharacterized protein (TIGR02186 family)
MKSCIFIFLFIFQISQSYSREPLLTDIVDKDINITASFDGAKIIIYGTIDSKLYKDTILIINVLGPSSQLKIRKKEKHFGIWFAGNKEMEFFKAPGYYALSSNIEDLDNFNDNILKELQIGWENLQMDTNFSSNINTRDNYKNLLKIFYKNRGLFHIGNNINTIGDTLFRAEFILPAITPTGIYSIKSFLFNSNGKLISTWNNSVKVSKEGLAEDLYDYSIEHPFLYGLLATLGAIIAGYIGSEIFRRI